MVGIRHRAGVHQSTLKKVMKIVYRDHLIEIQKIGNGPNAYFWISINGKRVAIAYESPLARAKEIVDLKEAAEIAADWVTVFYHVQAGVIETQEFLKSPIPHWLFCF
jgi:hypothetical protein